VAGGSLVQQRWTPEVRSPRLGIGFRLTGGMIVPYGPDGAPLKDDAALAAEAAAATARAEAAEAQLAALQARLREQDPSA
jgi:hypothetical protein